MGIEHPIILVLSPFVPEPPEQFRAPLHPVGPFHPLRLRPVDDPEDPSSGPRFGDDHLDSIRGRAVDGADLLDALHCIEDVDGEAVPEEGG